MPNFCLAGRLELNYLHFRSLPVKMKLETATEKERGKGSCMQTLKEVHEKIILKEGDKMLFRQERDNKSSTPFKQVPFTVV